MAEIRPSATDRLRRMATRARTLAVVYLIILFAATHVPSTALARLTWADKVYHFGAYATLTLCVLAGWELTIRRLEPKHYFAVWLVGTLYAIVDEATQIPVGRNADTNDWAADVVGIVCGIIAFQLVRMPVYRFFIGRDAVALGK